jgi:hypothetical protein
MWSKTHRVHCAQTPQKLLSDSILELRPKTTRGAFTKSGKTVLGSITLVFWMCSVDLIFQNLLWLGLLKVIMIWHH